jgi:MinD superfamily P-loop ATPase
MVQVLIVTVASGKGGTGKTTVAVNLALSLGKVSLLDCDVEEPNAHLLLQPTRIVSRDVERLVPAINEALCTLCSKCVQFCRFNALFLGRDKVFVYENICRSCGGCSVVCPPTAIEEIRRTIGRLHIGRVGDMRLVSGELNVGETVANTLIKAVKSEIDQDSVNILDAPPGTACPVIETMRGSDYVILVTEPTPFGAYDLSLTVDVVERLGMSCGVVINRSTIGSDVVKELCQKRGIPILLEIPFERRIAELYSRGVPFTSTMSEWVPKFRRMYDDIKEAVSASG